MNQQPEEGKASQQASVKNDFGSNTPEKLYDLKFHESYYSGRDNSWTVLRVAGGWIYTYHRLDAGQMNSVFVPFNNEFQKL